RSGIGERPGTIPPPRAGGGKAGEKHRALLALVSPKPDGRRAERCSGINAGAGGHGGDLVCFAGTRAAAGRQGEAPPGGGSRSESRKRSGGGGAGCAGGEAGGV